MTAFVTAPSIAWGPGAVEQLSALASRRAFLVADPAVAGSEVVVRALEELERGGAAVERELGWSEPQRVERVAELAARMRSFGPDCVVAIGGGALLDGAKAARLLLEIPDLPLDPPPSLLPFPEPPTSRLVAIPTTSGSGSEASWTCDLFAADGSPFELAHRGLVPDWALVDPAFAAGLSTGARRSGGLASAVTAAEAFVSAWSSPFSDALAVGALSTVVRTLPAALKWTDEPEARAALHYAATLAGLAASNAQRGVAHALSRALLAPTGLSYGTLLGLLGPIVLEFDRSGAREKLDLLAAAAAPSGETGRVELSERLRRLNQTVGAPRNLVEAGVDLGRLRLRRPEIVTRALRSPAVVANPRVPSAEDLHALLDQLEQAPRAAGASRSAR